MLIRKIRFEVLFLLCSFLFSQTKDVKVEIYGGKNLNAEKISALVSSLFDSANYVQKIEDEIINEYLKLGFFWARVDSITERNQTLKVYVREGERARFGKIEFIGNKKFSSEQLLSFCDVDSGEFFSMEAIQLGIERILKKYADNGHPLVEAKIEKMTLRNGKLTDVFIRIDEGREIKIDEVRILGNEITKGNFILRETRIKLGEVYRDEKIQQVRRRLLKLEIFEDVSEPEIFVTDTLAGIILKVKEGKMNSFDGVLGYVPSSPKGYFTGYLNIGLKNLFGTGRKFALRWNSETRETQEFDLRYFENSIFGLPAGAEISFFQRKQDSAYVIRKPQVAFEVEVSGTRDVSNILKIFITLSQVSVIPTATQEIGYSVLGSRTINISGGISYDSRDKVDFPSSGILLKSSFETGWKKINNVSGKVNRFNLEFEVFVPIRFVRGVFVPKFNAVTVGGELIDESDVFRFGGMRTLRGYREKEFTATRALWGNFEQRFRFGKDFIFLIFSDVAYIYRPSLLPRFPEKFEKVRTGFGAGVRLKSGIGWISLLYGLGKGDSFRTGKIHLGVESEF